MTDKDKLQKLFQAALLDVSEEKANLVRALPKATGGFPAPQAEIPCSPLPVALPADESAAPAPVSVAPATEFVQPMANAGLDAVSAEELRILLEEQHQRLKRRRRREMVGTLLFLLAFTGGGFGWFVHSPDRVQAFRDAVKEVRSVGDIAGMVAKYQKALAVIGTRAQDIDAATESMGVSSNQEGMQDVYLDAEMKEMMGGEGRTVGERNRMLQEKFGGVKEGGLKAALAPTSQPETPEPPPADHSLSLQE
ncbi:MAG: hypothetical protein ACRDBP_15510 [Luteolibacter sp.]